MFCVRRVTIFTSSAKSSVGIWEVAHEKEKNGTHTAVSKLVMDLGAHIDNVFSTSEQCTGAANKARRLNFMIKHYFEDLSKSDFIP